MLCRKLFLQTRSVTRLFSSSVKKSIDYSKVPEITKNDIEEHFIRGSGPGGSKVNKTSSCVQLKHIPTGIVLKCQETRFLQQNRKIAREWLSTKVDNFLNGENSVEAQMKAIADKKSASKDQKREKLRQLKKDWKERENIT